MKLPIGTRTVLFGIHTFWLHPWFVAEAWRRLYGFPWDPRLWCAFFLHDIGYIGKRDLDGAEGEKHVETGAAIMRALFGDTWGDFCLYHSRFYAKRDGKAYSRLCVADKLAILLPPRRLYLFLANLSGEAQEYKAARLPGGKYYDMEGPGAEGDIWYDHMVTYLVPWIAEHKDLKEDTWTRV